MPEHVIKHAVDKWCAGSRLASKGLNEVDFKLLTAQTRACIYVCCGIRFGVAIPDVTCFPSGVGRLRGFLFGSLWSCYVFYPPLGRLVALECSSPWLLAPVRASPAAAGDALSKFQFLSEESSLMSSMAPSPSNLVHT